MSNLLSQASLVMIPSGYKEDIVYSPIPTNGNGDLSFTRASNGTRVNSAGLVEVCPWNIAGYSEEFNNAYWTKAGATITANDTTAPNGVATADKVLANSGNTEHGVYNGAAFASNFVGEVYTYSVYAKKGTVDFLVLDHYQGSYTFTWFNLNTGTVGTVASGVTATIESVGNGWYRCSCTKAITATTLNFMGIYLSNANNTWSFNAAGTESIYIWGAQVNIGSTAKPYFPTTDRLNVPRLTYQNGGGGCPSLLLEKQSTNYVQYSEDFTNGWALTNAAATANQTTSPDGTQNADQIDNGFSNGQHRYYRLALSGLTNETLSFSLYAKQGTHRYISWGITDNSDYRGQVVVDLQTGTITDQSTASATLSNLSVVSQGNGWYRISGTIAVSSYYAGGNAYAFGLMLNSSSWSTASYTGTGTYCYLWGGQAELSSYPTSYIPTTSSSATRVADACSKTGISSLIGQTEGTILWDIQVDIASGPESILNLDAGSFANTIYLIKGTNSSLGVEMYASSILQSTYTLSSITAGRYKMALGYANNNTAFFINGTQVGTTDTSCSVPAMSRLQMGSTIFGPSDGKINELVLFPTRLTNAELASLTTI